MKGVFQMIEYPIFDGLLLPNYFSSGMVFQQQKSISVWGIAKPCTEILITLSSEHKVFASVKVTSKEDGSFIAELPPQQGSFLPHTLFCRSKEKTLRFDDILIGEVFLAAGQSNMQFGLEFSHNGPELMQKADCPYLRFCSVQSKGGNDCFRVRERTPQFSSPAVWGKGDNANQMRNISAVAYSFILNLYELLEQSVPVAFIDISVGGVFLETFLTPEQADMAPLLVKIMKEEDRYGEGENWGSHGEHNYKEKSSIFNERIMPIIHAKMRGIIWYQGEGNVGSEEKADAYEEGFEILLKSFRSYFGTPNEDIPFLFVHLAPFQYDDLWGLPYFWERQHQIFMRHNHDTAEIPIYDLPLDYDNGRHPEPGPIHPITKYPIGERLARAAAYLTYHIGSPYVPPYPICLEYTEKDIIVTFETGTPLKNTYGDKLHGFCICGKDRIFYPANAEILSRNQVRVWKDTIQSPVAVTYAFSNGNNTSNLQNEEGIMAVPFRTDKIPSRYSEELG